jgi:hypothetical protein
MSTDGPPPPAVAAAAAAAAAITSPLATSPLDATAGTPTEAELQADLLATAETEEALLLEQVKWQVLFLFVTSVRLI